jgi:MFS family permease
VWSTVGLVLTSLGGGLAPTIAVLVAARILEGIACAGILASGLGLIGRAFPAGPARTRATGLWGATLGAGIAAGPAASAALAALGSWRTIYWVDAWAPELDWVRHGRAAHRRGGASAGVHRR